MTPQLWFLTIVGSIVIGLTVLVITLVLALDQRDARISLLRREVVLAEDETRRARADLVAAYGQLQAVSDERTLLAQVIDKGLDDLLEEPS
ncbi:hypothetical protein ACQPZX_41540 [Actinoplanes sp. CA-142083]|uniref:hypothetical protein n=1 Tax=Actinoplanes sp. CA-142083 TaxID=3239903 RepID=UPI003D90408F